MKYSRRSMAATATILMATAGLAACSTGGTSADDTESIRILGFVPIPQEILDDFESETGISVEIDRQGGGDFPQILQSRVAAKSDIDVLNVRGGAEFYRYATAGTFADITSEDFLDNVSEVGIAPGVVDGKNYGYSNTSYVTGVFYNKDMFEKLAIEVPTSWEELTAAADKIKASGTAPFVFTASEAWTNQYFYHNAIAIHSQEDPQFMENVAKGEETWEDNSLFTRQIERFEELVDNDYFVPGAESISGQQGQDMFGSGDAAMYLMGTWTIATLDPEFELGMFALPINDSGEPASVASSLSDNMYTVTSWSKKQDAAKQFLEFMTRKEIAAQYAEANVNSSTIKGVTTDNVAYQDDIDALLEAAAPYPTNIGPSVNGTGPELLGDILAGVSDADKGIADFQELQESDNETDYYVSN